MNIAIKICGVQSPAITHEVAALGVPYIGINFSGHSPRKVDVNLGLQLAEIAKAGGAIPVAVVDDHNIEAMQTILAKTKIKHIQLHGEQSRQDHIYLDDSVKRIYVVTVNENGQANNLSLSNLSETRDYLLFDKEKFKSTKVLNTSNEALFKTKFKYFLAGGINVRNIGSILSQLKPYGIDVCSGVEDSNGEKDLSLVKQLIEGIPLEACYV